MKIVYLHGVGDGDGNMSWLEGLNAGLVGLGQPAIAENDVIAPKYSGMLRTQGIKAPHPKRTYTPRDDRDARRAFERRQARVARLLNKTGIVRKFGLGRVADGLVAPIQKFGISSAPVLAQVKNYMADEGLRGAVLQSILDAIPAKGDIVLIGHSLGSVIAIDLLDHLPETVHVRRFITIGSPAGSPPLHEGSERILKRFPYARVDDWSNFLDCRDPVTAGRGLTGIFAGAQDFGISGAAGHASALYLRNSAVAQLVSDVLYPTKDLVRSDGGVVLRLEDADATTLLALAYARRVGVHLKGDDKARFEDALALLQDSLAAAIVEHSEGRHLPPELAQLTQGQLPPIPRRWTLPETVSRTVVLAFTNVLDPYEIDAGDAKYDAIADIIVDLGWTSGTGIKVKDAVQEVAEYVLVERRRFGTKSKIAFAAAGLALLAAGPIGIAMGGVAGVAGAAALSSGLAALGPGGMIGGLVTLSGLASTGAMVTTIAATTGNGVQQLLVDPTSVAIQVAIAYALKKIDEPFDSELWYRLAEAETDLSAELNRLSPFSDGKAFGIQRRQEALKTIGDLMTFMLKNGLGPRELEQ
ncbi:hypothetical protein [Gordonia aichiensis]